MATGIVNPHAVASEFSPEQFPFKHLYWAGGPNMAAKGYADGDPIPVWPCEITGNSADDLVPYGGYASSIFQYAATAVNGNPAVYFNNAVHLGLRLAGSFSDESAMNAAASAGTVRSVLTVNQPRALNTTNSWICGNHNTGTGTAVNPFHLVWASAYAWNGQQNHGGTYNRHVLGTRTNVAVLLSDANNAGTFGQPEPSSVSWYNGAVFPSATQGTIGAWTPWGAKWGIGARYLSTTTWGSYGYPTKYTDIPFVGIYQHPTILMQDQPKFADLNTWFNNEYGYDIVT